MPTKDKEKQKEYSLRYYLKNKEAYYARNHLKRRRMQKWLVEQKKQPCADCNGSFPPYVMDFDHRDPTKKRATVSRLVSMLSWKAIKAEIALCELVCSNCHRIRTFNRLHGEPIASLDLAEAELELENI